MKKETVSLNAKEQQRVRILNGIERGGLTGEEAAALERMFLSLAEEVRPHNIAVNVLNPGKMNAWM